MALRVTHLETKSNPVGNVLVASLFLVAVSTLLGLGAAYVGGLISIWTGLGPAQLLVAFPLLTTLAVAWAATGKLAMRDAIVTFVVVAALAVLGWFVFEPLRLRGVLHHTSELTNVQVHGEVAQLEFRTETHLDQLPVASIMLGLAWCFACGTLALAVVVNGGKQWQQRRRDANPYRI